MHFGCRVDFPSDLVVRFDLEVEVAYVTKTRLASYSVKNGSPPSESPKPQAPNPKPQTLNPKQRQDLVAMSEFSGLVLGQNGPGSLTTGTAGCVVLPTVRFLQDGWRSRGLLS